MEEFHINYAPICQRYAKEQVSGTLYLAFRDVPQLIHRYMKHPQGQKIKALDFGCGTGVSARYLKTLGGLFEQGIDVEGVDINQEMLRLAIEEDPHSIYHRMQEHKIPVPDGTYDLVFSTFVLFEFATKEKMQRALEEVKRVMKPGALFIAATGSAESYDRSNQWVSLNVDFPQNDQLKSGDLGRVDFILGEERLTFQNYYWKENDYLEVFRKAGLICHQTHRPLGYIEEENALTWRWKNETSVSPYYVFVLVRATNERT